MTEEKIRDTGEDGGIMKRFMIESLHQMITSAVLWAGHATSHLL
jgi:hypothetical protein